jgi:hypothetical protein
VSTHDASLWGLVLTVLGKSQTPKRCGGLVDGRAGFEMERLVFVHMTAYGKLLFTADSDFESCRKSDDSRDCEAKTAVAVVRMACWTAVVVRGRRWRQTRCACDKRALSPSPQRIIPKEKITNEPGRRRATLADSQI